MFMCDNINCDLSYCCLCPQNLCQHHAPFVWQEPAFANIWLGTGMLPSWTLTLRDSIRCLFEKKRGNAQERCHPELSPRTFTSSSPLYALVVNSPSPSQQLVPPFTQLCFSPWLRNSWFAVSLSKKSDVDSAQSRQCASEVNWVGHALYIRAVQTMNILLVCFPILP